MKKLSVAQVIFNGRCRQLALVLSHEWLAKHRSFNSMQDLMQAGKLADELSKRVKKTVNVFFAKLPTPQKAKGAKNK